MPNSRAVACPAAFLGELHHAVYDLDTGVWKCRSCGLGGNVQGFARLTELEAERHGLQTELDIAIFEKELLARELPHRSAHESVDALVGRLEAIE